MWAEQHPNLKIGMGQSGIASFFAPNVTNLDGKVNPDALKAIQGDSLGAYIKRTGFDYINDWVGIAEPILRSAQRYGAEYAPVDTIERVILYKRVTP